MTERAYHRKTRAIIAITLLLAMLLTACGTVQEQESEAPEESSAPIEATPTPDTFQTEIVISELQPSNKATVTDADGDFSDWIELYNPGAESEDLSGCWLSDSDKDPCKWQIPSLTLAGGEYKIIFCSKKDRAGDELHTNFSLSKDGDTIYLSSPSGTVLRKISYEACKEDSALRVEGDTVIESWYPTPGYPNTDDGYEAFAGANDNHGALVINEAMAYNDSFNLHAGGYYDWVELKNVSDETIMLSDYYVTDKTSLPAQFQLPGTMLKPGETFVVFCGEPLLETVSCHAPFKLSAAGDSFYIYRADGSLSDYISLYGMPVNHSKGRIDGASGFYYFPFPTPAAPNGSYCARYLAKRPESVTPSGVYNDVDGIDVELSGEGTIYYTLDGNLPDTESYVYSEPIHLTETTMIRAASYVDSKLRSETATFTYVINEHHTLPVVCVALEPSKLNILYYHNGKMEYDSHTEFYDTDGGSFTSDCMITLHGAASRNVWDKKSFKVVFRDRYGGDINYDLFGQGITEFHSLNLRGGDTVYMKTYREPLAAEFADRVAVTDPYALDSRFCILYVNGSYYGIYSLREAYSKKYIESHTGSEESMNTISRAPIKIEYQPELFSLYSFIASCDISDPDNYNYIADRMDMQSLAQWLLLESYFNNRDTAGNIRYFRGVQPDSKWRTMFFDLDISMENPNAYLWEICDPSESQIGRILSKLLRNDEFKKVMLETASGLYKNGLGYELALEILDRMVEELEPEMSRNLGRWGESRGLMESNLIGQRRVFSEQRDESWLQIVQSVTGVSDETMREYFPERG